MTLYNITESFNKTKQKQRISSFVKRYGLEFTATKTTWTKAYYKWLKKVELPTTARLVFDEMILELLELENRVDKINNELDLLLHQNKRYGNLFYYYCFY